MGTVLPPPPPQLEKRANEVKETATKILRRNDCRFQPASNIKAANPGKIVASTSKGRPRVGPEGQVMADGPVVVMVSVEDWKVALGLIVAGLNEQAARAGSPEQLKVSGLVKDGLEKMVITS